MFLGIGGVKRPIFARKLRKPPKTPPALLRLVGGRGGTALALALALAERWREEGLPPCRVAPQGSDMARERSVVVVRQLWWDGAGEQGRLRPDADVALLNGRRPVSERSAGF
jgi:hypothetical protein